MPLPNLPGQASDFTLPQNSSKLHPPSPPEDTPEPIQHDNQSLTLIPNSDSGKVTCEGTVIAQELPALPQAEKSALPKVAGYEVIGEIARGGMGVVYTAREHSLGREVAIKTILPMLAIHPEYAEQFAREARVTAQLPHPGVPPVHALGKLPGGRPFLAMKLIKGRTLAAELEIDRVANLPRLTQVFEQICHTVGFAHSVGIVHRDLKPLNVMVGAFGEVQVMDWGLARVSNDEGETVNLKSKTAEKRIGDSSIDLLPSSSRTVVGSVKGTPAYMPPEQARGEWDKVDARADVFALGGILCAILTGRAPYLGSSTSEILGNAAAGELRETFERLDRSGADVELVALCKKCLSPNPADRPADGKSVADGVAEFRAGQEMRTRKAENERAAAEAMAEESMRRAEAEERARLAAEARAVEQRKRRHVQLALAGAVGLLFAAGGAFAWWQERQAEEAKLKEARFETENERSEAARIKAERESELQRTRNRESAISSLNQVEKALQAGDAERAGEALEQAAKRIAEGGADDLQDRVSRCRNELDMLRKLVGIDNDHWTAVEGKLPEMTAITQRFQEIFAEYGIAVDKILPQEAARRIDVSPIRERLLTSLETWFIEGGRVPAVREILALADPDAFRNEARATSYTRALSSQEPRGKQVVQPVWFAVSHGKDKLVDRNTREKLLLTAHQFRPNNFELLMALATLDEAGDKESGPSRAGWCRAALAVHPRNVAAWNNLGAALMDGGDLPEAMAAAKEAIRLEPKLTQAHCNLGYALYHAGDLPGATLAFREATRINPRFALAHTNLGLALRDSGDPRAAIIANKEAIRLDPHLSLAHNNLGIALSDCGDLPGAVAALKEAIRLKPKYALAYTNLGAVLYNSRDLSGAIIAHKEAIRLDPGYAPSHNNLGLALYDSGDKDGAIAAYREAIRLDPKFASAQLNFGNILYGEGDFAKATAAYRDAIRLDPKYVKAYNNLGNSLNDSGDRPGAIAAYREAIRLDPKFAMAFNGLGNTLIATGDLPGAIAALQEAIRLDPKLAMARFNLGEAFRASGDNAGAIAAYGEAIRLEPGYAPSHAYLGMVLRASGDPSGAVTAYKEAIRLKPKDKLNYYNLGTVYMDQNRYTDAIACAREASRLDSKYADAQALLGVGLQRTGDPIGARTALSEAIRLDSKKWTPFVGQLLAELMRIPTPAPLAVAPPPRERK